MTHAIAIWRAPELDVMRYVLWRSWFDIVKCHQSCGSCEVEDGEEGDFMRRSIGEKASLSLGRGH